MAVGGQQLNYTLLWLHIIPTPRLLLGRAVRPAEIPSVRHVYTVSVWRYVSLMGRGESD